MLNFNYIKKNPKQTIASVVFLIFLIFIILDIVAYFKVKALTAKKQPIPKVWSNIQSISHIFYIIGVSFFFALLCSSSNFNCFLLFLAFRK